MNLTRPFESLKKKQENNEKAKKSCRQFFSNSLRFILSLHKCFDVFHNKLIIKWSRYLQFSKYIIRFDEISKIFFHCIMSHVFVKDQPFDGVTLMVTSDLRTTERFSFIGILLQKVFNVEKKSFVMYKC